MKPAMDPTATGLMVAAASLLSGLAVSWLSVILVGLVDADPEAAPPRAIFERDRQRRLRCASTVYRYFGPSVRQLAGWNESKVVDLCSRVAHWLIASRTADWTAGEFLAVAELKGVALAAVVTAPSTWELTYSWCVCLFAVVGAGSLLRSLWKLKRKADERTRQVRARLPVAVDLLALVFDAGGTDVSDGLEVVVRVMAGHPLAEEFAVMLRDIRKGMTRTKR